MSTTAPVQNSSGSGDVFKILPVEDQVRTRLEAERKRLQQEAGIEEKEVHHFHKPIELPFTALQRDHTTILFGGLTWKHERLVHAALESLGYRCESVPVPNKKAFQLGKEYGNNGQCNPTYFTVGNLVQFVQRPRSQGPDQGRNLRPLRLLHRGRLRPLPLRHVRIGIPAGAAQCGLRQVPRAAVPAERRPEPGRSRSRPGNEPGFLPGHPERAEYRRHHERRRLPDSPLRSERRTRPTACSKNPWNCCTK